MGSNGGGKTRQPMIGAPISENVNLFMTNFYLSWVEL